MTTIEVSKTLAVMVETGHDAHLAISRDGGGLVTIRAGEVRHLVEALTEAAGLLARAAAKAAQR